ncbi:MAG: DUF4139 domain-containing protein [Gammaproteobacteria bacterium]
MYKSIIAVIVLAAGGASVPAVAAGDDPATIVTIYSQSGPGGVSPDLYRPLPGRGGWAGSGVPGYAVIREDRDLTLSSGRSSLQFTDVAALIDPTTVRFRSLTDPDGTRVLEQDFRFDLVSTDRLLERYLDRPVTVYREDGRLTGTLMSTSGGLVLGMEDGTVEVLREYQRVAFPELPGGLITRPTLVWDLLAERDGRHRTRVAYQTAGITWWADYNFTWHEGRDANSGTLDVNGWVSIVNQSGASYEDARLKLIAGDVQRVAEPGYADRVGKAMLTSVMEDAAGFEEKSFFEFHLYTLGRDATLPDRSTKQLELFPAASGVPARKVLVYRGARHFTAYPRPRIERDYGVASNRKVDVYIEFENRAADGLGMPLPAGRIRVSQLDEADGSLEFIGEDTIDHTPKNEDVRIRLGSAFDVLGERRQTDYEVDSRGHWLEEEFEIVVTNRKEEAVDVLVQENLHRWRNWEILSSSAEWQKMDAGSIRFPVTVAPDGQETVRYRVRYTW